MLILGSSSPRRKEILSFFKIPFNIVSPNYDELKVPYEGNPKDYVETISLGKALAIKELQLGLPILTADTIVHFEGKIFLKPNSLKEAAETLSFLSGKIHTVLTAITMMDEKKEKTVTTETFVTFHPFTKEQIDHYIQSLSVLDKAGSYAIQGIGSLIVKKIDGCFYNVMGLPLNTTFQLLEEFGFNLWDHLKQSST
jgi:septum formation protein